MVVRSEGAVLCPRRWALSVFTMSEVVQKSQCFPILTQTGAKPEAPGSFWAPVCVGGGTHSRKREEVVWVCSTSPLLFLSPFILDLLLSTSLYFLKILLCLWHHLLLLFASSLGAPRLSSSSSSASSTSLSLPPSELCRLAVSCFPSASSPYFLFLSLSKCSMIGCVSPGRAPAPPSVPSVPSVRHLHRDDCFPTRRIMNGLINSC